MPQNKLTKEQEDIYHKISTALYDFKLGEIMSVLFQKHELTGGSQAEQNFNNDCKAFRVMMNEFNKTKTGGKDLLYDCLILQHVVIDAIALLIMDVLRMLPSDIDPEQTAEQFSEQLTEFLKGWGNEIKEEK